MAGIRPLMFTLSCFLGSVSASARADDIDFSRDVRPILSEKCFACHGPDERARQADLRLDVRRSASRVLVPMERGVSELLDRISSSDADVQMPPPETGKRVTKEERERIRRWIAAGAPYAGHWSLQVPRQTTRPRVRQSKWPRNEVDHFILAKLESEGIRPSSPADPEVLLRRVTLDLTGLPPTPAEVAAFLADESPVAYEKVVDRLLASPRYGEQMASYWLDAARYADTDGYQNDRYRYMHPWRDWVIMALNEGLPFDEFVVEQLAGDLLPDATLLQQIATGFCRNHRINSEDGSIPQEWRIENVADRVDTLGTVFLGLTIGCARCHDHKFDPISQREYYRLFAYFNNVAEWGIGPNNGNSPPFVEVPQSWAALRECTDDAVTPEPVKLRPARENEAGNGLKRPQAGGPETLMVMHDLSLPRPTYLLRRGQYNLPDTSEVLSPGVPESLCASGTGVGQDRLGLARWLVSAENPLTARVTVNRYWQRFFGVGLVKTSDNFGMQGELPSHPKLLDWLAVEFRKTGWDVKRIHKTILMSASYRQASELSPATAARDPENRLLSRGPRFRLHPFVLRDQALLISGLLVEQLGGPPVKPYMPPQIWRSISNNQYEQDHAGALYRRSLYTYWRRTIPPPSMLSFNAAEREVCVVRKDRTNTPLQALTLMNNITYVESARFMAERMQADGGTSPTERLSYGVQLAVARLPSSQELSILIDAHGAFLSAYSANIAAAEQLLAIGECSGNPALDTVEQAALTMTASLILNLDETITKE